MSLKQVQIEFDGNIQQFQLQVPHEMTSIFINRKVSETIGLPIGSYSLFYLDDLTSTFQCLAEPEDYTPLAYIALYKGLLLQAHKNAMIYSCHYWAVSRIFHAWKICSRYEGDLMLMLAFSLLPTCNVPGMLLISSKY